MFRKKSKKPRARQHAHVEQSLEPLKPVKAIRILIEMREKAGVTTYRLASLARVDSKYLWRLERGEARNPGREALIRLARALVGYTKLFSESDVDCVLAAADYAPAPMPG